MKENKMVFRKDIIQTKLLHAAGRRAGATALLHAKALGLTITYIKNGTIVEEQPNGHIKVVKKLVKAEAPIVLIKGMVLRAK